MLVSSCVLLGIVMALFSGIGVVTCPFWRFQGSAWLCFEMQVLASCFCWQLLVYSPILEELNLCHVFLRLFVSHSLTKGRRNSHGIPYILHNHSTWMLGDAHSPRPLECKTWPLVIVLEVLH